MHSGEQLGRAIAQAIEKKISSGSVKTKADIARHFKIKPPSIHDWIKRGSISKEKLPELWRYFSDVVGPEHWGLSEFPINMLVNDDGQKTLRDDFILESYLSASVEKQAVVNFLLLRNSEPAPEWVDSDARAYASALELKAKMWLENKSKHTKASA